MEQQTRAERLKMPKATKRGKKTRVVAQRTYLNYDDFYTATDDYADRALFHAMANSPSVESLRRRGINARPINLAALKASKGSPTLMAALGFLPSITDESNGLSLMGNHVEVKVLGHFNKRRYIAQYDILAYRDGELLGTYTSVIDLDQYSLRAHKVLLLDVLECVEDGWCRAFKDAYIVIVKDQFGDNLDI